MAGEPLGNYYRRTFDLHPDGERFVVARSDSLSVEPTGEAAEPERLFVVINWFDELRQLVEN